MYTFKRFKNSMPSHLLIAVPGDYNKLCEVLGAPKTDVEPGKVRAEWGINLYKDGVFQGYCYIYDWKCGSLPLEEVYHWNVGGTCRDVVEPLVEFFHQTGIHKQEQGTLI